MKEIPHYLMRQIGKATFYDMKLQDKLRDFKVGQTFVFVTPDKAIVFECKEIQKHKDK